MCGRWRTSLWIFLSTPSGWRATSSSDGKYVILDFYPRPPGGGRHEPKSPAFCTAKISIHALRVEGDSSLFLPRRAVSDFYPRPPGGGRPLPLTGQRPRRPISIHALRVEGDRIGVSMLRIWINFYPRPPGGGRQQKRTKFSSVFAQKGEEFASLRRGKRKICRWRFKKDKFWVLIWCEGSGKSVCALASHCG